MTVAPDQSGDLSFLTGKAMYVAFPDAQLVAPALLVDRGAGRIVAVGQDAVQRQTEALYREDYPNGVIIPGLIDCHVHLVFPGNGMSGEVVVEETDEDLLSRALVNAQGALRSGVVMVQDQGGRGMVPVIARSAAREDRAQYPELRVAGRPITLPKGHMWFLGGEATGESGVAALATELIESGVDSLKLVASGGGTAGSNDLAASFSTAELRAAVDLGHRARLPVMAHATNKVAIKRALDSGCDVIHHCSFYDPDRVMRFDPRLADELAQAGVVVDPTLWVNESLLDARRADASSGKPEDLAAYESIQQFWVDKQTEVAGLIGAGVRLVVGSDAGWGFAAFGDTWREVIALANFGLPIRDALAGATRHAASVLHLDGETGRLAAGLWADILVLPDDPIRAPGALGHPLAVYRQGSKVI